MQQCIDFNAAKKLESKYKCLSHMHPVIYIYLAKHVNNMRPVGNVLKEQV